MGAIKLKRSDFVEIGITFFVYIIDFSMSLVCRTSQDNTVL